MSADSEQASPVELLAEEFLERQQRGERPTIKEYCERHPELADEIREVFEALAMMEELKPDSQDATGTFGSGLQSDGKRLERVGDYRVLREIGRGGMGVVYEAEQESLKRRVALKVMPRRTAGDEKALQRFQREARAAARMHHTNIVPVFDVGEDDEHVFYAMQMIQGQGLDLVIDDLKRMRTEQLVLRDATAAERAREQRELEQRHSIAASLVTGQFHQENLVATAQSGEAAGTADGVHVAAADGNLAGAFAETVLQGSGSTTSAVLPGQSQLTTAETNRSAYFHSVAEIGLQTARALSYAHARGIIHRDIKPSNLLLDAAGVVWVTDFGLAKTSDEAMTHTGDILGTIRYMSPERFRGQCDVRADVYSLGLTLYELLVLRPAFASPDRLRLVELVSSTEPPTPRSLDPRIPRDLETIILKSIDKDPRRRYQSADELCEDLERFIQDEPIKARRISYVERFGRWSRRNKALASSLAVVAGLVTFLAIGSTIAAGYFQHLNGSLAATLSDLEIAKDEADEAARENAQLAADKQNEAQRALEARDEVARQQELTRRNLYAAEINMAQLAGLTGDIARREELLAHWRTTDEANDLRGWEWYYLLAEGLDDHLEIRSHADRVGVVAFSPDGKRVASGGRDGDVHVCDPTTGDVLLELQGHQGPVFGLDWSPDGARLATSGGDEIIRVWDVASAQEVLTIVGHSAMVFRVAWDPRGERLASASWDGTARIWNANTGAQLTLLRGNGQQVWNVAWHPDGDRLASVGMDPSVHVWDATTGREIESFQGHAFRLFGVDWHPDGERLAGSGQGGQIVWRSGQSSPVWRIEGEGGFSQVAFSPAGRLLAIADTLDNIRIHDVETGAEIAALRGHPDIQTGLSWSPDSKRLATSSFDGTVRIWHIEEQETPRVATGPEVIFAADWSPDGRLFATGDETGKVRLWDADSREVIREFVDPEGSLVHVIALAFSPDGAQIAAGGRLQNEVLIWDVAGGDPIRLAGPPLKQVKQYSGIRSLAWDVRRERIAAGNSEGGVLFWNPRTGELLESHKPSNSGANALCFVPETDGRWLVSGHVNGQVNVWNLDAGEVTQTFSLPGIQVFEIDSNGSGKRLAAAGGRYGNQIQGGFAAVRVWNVHRQGDRIELRDEATLRGPKDVVRSVRFSPDGARLVAGGLDGTVYCWDMTGSLDVAVRRQLLDLKGEQTAIHSVRMSPDGIRLAAAGRGDGIEFWDARAGYAHEFSPMLLSALERKALTGAATREDYLLRARILARQANWSAAAASFDRLLELPGAEPWYSSDIWVLDGAYPRELETEFPPEEIRDVRDFDVLESLAGAAKQGFPQTLRWRPRPHQSNLHLDFGGALEHRSHVTGYALLRVYTARSQPVGIVLGADDEHRLWLNGEQIHENQSMNSARPDEHAVPAVLRQGWNTLLAKVSNAEGQHGLFLRLSSDPRELAPIYARSGEVEAAREAWDRTVASSPDDPKLLIERAVFLWNHGQREAAKRDFERAVELPGNETFVRLLRARKFVQLRRDDDALADFDRAVELTPESPMLLIERGEANVKIGRLDAAAADIAAAVALNPTNHWDTYHLTSLLLQVGDEAGFEKLRTDMLNRWGDSTNATVAERTCKAYLLRPADEAALGQLDSLMKATRKVDPQHPYFRFFLMARGMLRYRQGEALLAAGDDEQARQRFRAALRLLNNARSRGLGGRAPTHCDLYRAMTLQRLNQPERAMQALRQAEEDLASDKFTQPGQHLDGGWHDEFMPRITHQEATRLILGPAYLEFYEGERLLAAGELEAALKRLENAIRVAADASDMLARVTALCDEHRAGYGPLVPTSNRGRPADWQYRFTPPPDGWNTFDNRDDAGWSSGPAPFGSYENPVHPNTDWPDTNSDIWLRSEFEVTPEQLNEQLAIWALIDEEAEVFINGAPAASGEWVGAVYQKLACAPAAARAIQSGTNLLAVHCTNAELGAKVDVGLYINNHAVEQRLLTAALAATPDSPSLREQRAMLNVRLERWHDAALDWEQYVQANPEASSIAWMQGATLHAVAVGEGDGEIEDYVRFCNLMIKRFADSDKLADVERTMKSCLLLAIPESGIEGLSSERVTGALAAGTVQDNFIPWFNLACALEAYRRGDFAAAERFAGAGSGTLHFMNEHLAYVVEAPAQAVRSLALDAQGQRDQARAAFAIAQSALQQGPIERRPDGSLVGKSALNGGGRLRHDDLIAALLVREAEAGLE